MRNREMRNYLIQLILISQFSFFIFLLPSCEKENYARENEVKLEFSADTVAFDTLFTTVGSATRQVRVYNRSGKDVLLSTVSLGKGRASRFRLNVDGDTSMVARNVEILAGDSIFIFVQVNVKPNDQTSPFIEEDVILFGNGQRLPLTAWGRNAYYHLPTDTLVFSDGSFMICDIVDCAEWNLRQHDKPHVIIGTAAVLDGSTLNLTAGDELYFYNDAMLIFDTNARLTATGTASQPVLFTSLRHDGWYSFLPGQWQCILFTGGSHGNTIDHAVIENGTGGLRVYPDADLTVSNTVVRNMSDCGLIGQGGAITGTNLLVYDCLGALTVIRGGQYSFTGCTFADYWSYSMRKQESVVLCNYLQAADGTLQADALTAAFTDCIVWGSREEELLMLGVEEYPMNCTFTHCWLKGTDGAADPQFEDSGKDNYRLQEGSPAAGIGYQYND